ncbi:hypothetical protein JKP88DRAFT_207569 [Tribonema minus]|uniref:Uncharacterized protein n=1 Tax=Tribonema minus TaxID=303371 RepID=A0A835Z595_9STRA|nr:hypothetical protein JKP88DRAFT_207569 [Tribonema minus]
MLAAAVPVCALLVLAAPAASFMPPARTAGPHSLTMSTGSRSADCISRRGLLTTAVATVTAAAVVAPGPAHALFGSSDPTQTSIEELARYTVQVDKLISDLKSKNLKGGPEDSLVVFRTMKTYFDPLQATMAKAAPTLGLAGQEQQERAVTLSLLMKGHLLELTAACTAQNAGEQLKETEEVQETLEEFLKLAGTKYKIPTYAPPRSATPAEYYGAFGCEAWGQKRMPNSNSCEPDV